MADIPVKIVLSDGTSHDARIDSRDLLKAEIALCNDIHSRLLQKKDMIVDVTSYYRDPSGIERLGHGKGVRISRAIFVTCANLVAEHIAESDEPIAKYFRRVGIRVNDKVATMLTIGSSTPLGSDIAILKVTEDSGSVAAIKKEAPETYKIVFSVQMMANNFIISPHRIQKYDHPGLGIAQGYGDPSMSGSPILDEDGEVVGILKGCVGERMLCIAFISGEAIHAAAKHARIEDQIHWI